MVLMNVNECSMLNAFYCAEIVIMIEREADRVSLHGVMYSNEWMIRFTAIVTN
jgi:hypothetical protein